MYQFIPKKTNYKAILIIFALFAASMGLFAFTTIFDRLPLRWIYQLIGVVCFIPSRLLLTRYVTRSFIYAIEPTDRGGDFTVTEVAGKRRTVTCRIALGSIKEKQVVSDLKDARSKKIRIFDYRPDILPEKSILLLSDEGGETVYICLGYDEELLSALPSPKKEDGDEQ